MSIFYSNQNRLRDLAGEGQTQIVSSHRMSAIRLGVTARWVTGRTVAAFKNIHRGIVAAKACRLQRELRLHEMPPPPLILDDKWDF